MKNSKNKAPAPGAAAATAPAERISTRTLAVLAGVAVVLAVAMFGFRAGWFASAPEEGPGPRRNADGTKVTENGPPKRIASASGGLAQASWDPLPAGTPIAGVGPTVSPDAPTQIAVPADGARAAAGVRVPRKRTSGASYTAYSLELRSGTQRVWSTYLPAQGMPDDVALLALSFDVGAMRAGGVDTSAMTLVVTGSVLSDRKMRDKYDAIGLVRLSIP